MQVFLAKRSLLESMDMATMYEGEEEFYGSSRMKKSESIVLKVQINCECCARKVKKAIAQVEGVESIVVDIKQKKVTVTGSFDSNTLMRKVAKTGKNVEMAGAKNKNEKSGGDKLKPLTGQSTAFPAEDTFWFSEDNATSCTIM